MTFKKPIQFFEVVQCYAPDGREFERRGPKSWFIWMGSSLEVVNDELETAELERAYLEALT